MSGNISILGSLPLAREGSFWFPPQASSFAPGLDFTYDVTLWICVIFFVGICGTTLWFVFKYRARPGHKEQRTATHNLPLEMVWSIAPLGLLMLIFGLSTYWYMQMLNPPKDEQVYDITVRGQKWFWSFTYQGDPFEGQMFTDQMHVIVGQPYRLVMDSPDVIHSMYLPAFRVKQDCVPGRYNRLWFRPTMVSPPEGFDLFCTEYCGDNHSNMITKVHVHETYESWRDAIIKEGDLEAKAPIERGRIIYERNCKLCHTIDGKPLTGPSFKDLWGKEEHFEDGTTAIVTQAYVRESLNTPPKKIVKGFKPLMTPFAWKDDYMYEGVFAYLKSLQTDEELRKR